MRRFIPLLQVRGVDRGGRGGSPGTHLIPDRCTLAAEGVLPVTARSRDRQEKGGPLPVHLARAKILSQTHLLVAICSFSPLLRIRYSL